MLGALRQRRFGWPQAFQLFCLVSSALFIYHALRFTLFKNFSVDENTFLHGAWLVSKGQLPTRDFFLGFPLGIQYFSVPFALFGDGPAMLRIIRFYVAASTLGLVGWAAWIVNRDRESAVIGLTAPLLLFNLALLERITEIRPDCLAFGFFMAAIGIHRLRRIQPDVRGWISGFLVIAAGWVSVKVFVYGLGFCAVWLIDLAFNLPLRRRAILSDPFAFFGGAALATAMILFYIFYTQPFWPWYDRAIRFLQMHQMYYPSFSWLHYFVPLMVDRPIWFPLAAIGLVSTIGLKPPQWRLLLSDPDLLLVLSLPTTLISFTMQQAPYPYSLIPFGGFVAIFAVRGVGTLWAVGRTPAMRTAARAVVVAVLAVQFAYAHATLQDRMNQPHERNEYQVGLIEDLHWMTAETDPVYDNSGGAIIRPSLHYYYFTDLVTLLLLKERLVDEIPQLMRQKGCVAWIYDVRTERLSLTLQEFLKTHFVPYNDDLWLLGHRYYTTPDAKETRGTFSAFVDGQYFLWPESALKTGTVTVGGQTVGKEPFTLQKGDWPVVYTGKAKTIAILWLPRNGRTYKPFKAPHPKYSRLFLK